ncbi:MAG: histidine phosphatase family protein [Pseudobdellovibrionaceae bacterium]|jgi:broad specificity phosphatase PhoE|nr:histidine phosphatase family protein [Pseudobdellovibrionaceae bacterium]
MADQRHIILVRHVPVSNPDRIWYGRDVKLAPSTPELETLFNYLAQTLPQGPEKVIWTSSPYPRALHTAWSVADRILSQKKPAIEIDEVFVEQQYGVMEGLPHQRAMSLPSVAAYLQDTWNNSMEGGESMSVFQMRVARALESLKERTLKEKKDAVVFTHGGVLMAAYAYVTGQKMSDILKQRKGALAPSISFVSRLTLCTVEGRAGWKIPPVYETGIPKQKI